MASTTNSMASRNCSRAFERRSWQPRPVTPATSLWDRRPGSRPRPARARGARCSRASAPPIDRKACSRLMPWSPKPQSGRDDEPLGWDHLQGSANEIGHLFGALDLQGAKADDANCDLLAGPNTLGKAFQLVAAIVGRFEGDDVDVKSIEIGQGVRVIAPPGFCALGGGIAPAGVAPHFALLA